MPKRWGLQLVPVLLAILPVFAVRAPAQQVQRWSATTGDLSLSTSATAATIQQPGTEGSDTVIEQIVVYCSVACSVSQAGDGSPATATAGTVVPLLPTQGSITPPVNFFTSSNVGAGTAQGGIVHIPAGGTVVLCLNTGCGNGGNVAIGRGAGASSNYTVSIASINGTANITFYLRSTS